MPTGVLVFFLFSPLTNTFVSCLQLETCSLTSVIIVSTQYSHFILLTLKKKFCTELDFRQCSRRTLCVFAYLALLSALDSILQLTVIQTDMIIKIVGNKVVTVNFMWQLVQTMEPRYLVKHYFSSFSEGFFFGFFCFF